MSISRVGSKPLKDLDHTEFHVGDIVEGPICHGVLREIVLDGKNILWVKIRWEGGEETDCQWCDLAHVYPTDSAIRVHWD